MSNNSKYSVTGLTEVPEEKAESPASLADQPTSLPGTGGHISTVSRLGRDTGTHAHGLSGTPLCMLAFFLARQAALQLAQIDMCATGLFFKAYVKPQLTQCSIWRTFFHLKFPL